MAPIQKCEDLKVWQKARALSQKIYQLIFLEPISLDSRFRDQLKGTLGFVMDNIAEGLGRSSRLEFSTSFKTPRGETDELKSHLYCGFDNNYFCNEQVTEFYASANEGPKMNTSLITSLNKSK